MPAEKAEKKVIGRVEKLSFPELGFSDVHARVDTGAKTSALWASSAVEKDGQLAVVFFAKGTDAYTGETAYFEHFQKTVVASSNGQTEERYKVRVLVSLRGKKIRSWFTLADRSTQVYPVLIGRNVLRGKFVVDVKHGTILRDKERERSEVLQSKLMPKKPEKQ